MSAVTHAQAAQRLYDQRRLRDAMFGDDREGFGEPGWDMLLLLMARDGEAAGIARDELLAASGEAAPIADLYLQRLATRELAKLSPGETGAVAISDRGRALVTAFLDQAAGIERVSAPDRC